MRSEIEKQFKEAAEEIVRAHVEKAKAGSLQHTKWLCSLVELQESEAGDTAVSISEMLVRALEEKR